MENRNLKVSFNKSGSGSYTPRLSLPITWIREMGINEDDREVIVSLCEDFIMVRKKDFNFLADSVEDRNENKKSMRNRINVSNFYKVDYYLYNCFNCNEINGKT